MSIIDTKAVLKRLFFTDTATTEIYTLSLHDALPISRSRSSAPRWPPGTAPASTATRPPAGDRKSTRLNSSHVEISYAVFCLKKKKNTLSIILSTQHPSRHAYVRSA